MKSILENWQDFNRRIIPPAASAEQREEMRRAFYSGAAAFYGLVLLAVDPPDDQACAVNLKSLDRELRQFPFDLKLPAMPRGAR